MKHRIKKFYKENLSKVAFNDPALWKGYWSVFGVFSSIVTVIAFFFTANTKCSRGVFGILFVGILTLGFVIQWWTANHLNSTTLTINGTKVVITEGNIFDQLHNPDKHPDEVSVIAANDHFDDIVDDIIISKTSLHGQYISQIIEANKLDGWNKALKSTIRRTSKPQHDPKREGKPGRQEKYRLGSMFEYEGYILTAFSCFDENNEAYHTAETYARFWMRFWTNIDQVYAGKTINLPLMGAGITRFRNRNLSKQELLESMLWTLKLSGFKITSGGKELRIIIYKDDIPEINFYQIKNNHMFK